MTKIRFAALFSAVLATMSFGPAVSAAHGAPPAAVDARAAGTYVPLAPTRIMDTRRGLGGQAAAAFGTTTLQVGGRGGVPDAGVSAVVLTVTVAAAQASGVLTAYPAGTVEPATSNLNFGRNDSVANQVVLPLGTSGRVVFANHASARTDLVADVSAYYLGGESSVPGSYVPTAPRRIVDTRSGLGGRTRHPASVLSTCRCPAAAASRRPARRPWS